MYSLAYLMEHSRELVVFHIADAVKPKQMSGASAEEIIEEYPDLTAEDISACLIHARDLSDFEVAA